LTVKKLSESILKRINDEVGDKSQLISPLASLIQYNSNTRLKPLLVDLLTDLIEHVQEVSP
jgi:hypothetical protein